MPDTSLPFVLTLQGGSNFRDLGGYKTADGRTVRRSAVFRSAHLGGLTDEDRGALGRLGVRTIVDLRGVSEAAETPHLIEGLECRIVGAHIEPGVGEKIRGAVADGSANPHIMMGFLTDHYRDYPRRCAPGFRTLFSTLSDGTHRPLVFHCTAGKDRTGFAAALLLSALGVDRATIEHDYLLTNQLYKRDNRLEGSGHPHVMKVLWQVQPEFLHAAFEAVDTQHGGMQDYLHGAIGLSPQELAALQRLMLED
jgi:protein-tyrosine phosphatase